MTTFPRVPVGTMVTVEAPGGRGDNGLTRTIPAVVLGQWGDGSLQLYALHFEGSFLMNSVPYEMTKPIEQAQKPESVLQKKFTLRDAS